MRESARTRRSSAGKEGRTATLGRGVSPDDIDQEGNLRNLAPVFSNNVAPPEICHRSTDRTRKHPLEACDLGDCKAHSGSSPASQSVTTRRTSATGRGSFTAVGRKSDSLHFTRTQGDAEPPHATKVLPLAPLSFAGSEP